LRDGGRMTTLSVVIPAYNEEKGITKIINRVLAVQNELAKVNVDEMELLVVDDGSQDDTARIAREVAACNENVWIISHARNRGYGAALKTGFSKARGELIGFLDADGTYPPEYLPKLCEASLNGWDLVIGSRMAGEETEMPIVRKLGNKFFASLINLLGQSHITDSASGMRVFQREILPRLYPLPDGLNLTPIMSTRAICEGIRMLEIPIPYAERVGNSKLSAIKDGTRYVQSITWTILGYNPVRVLGLIGLAGIIYAGVVGLGLIIARLMGITSLPPWGVFGVYTAMVAAVSGISIFALGTTFNYLVTLFYKHPIRQGIFGRPLLDIPLERHFGIAGIITLSLGLLLGAISMILGLQGWEISRLWFYLLGSALLTLVGIQLIIYWILIQILDELSRRDVATQQELTLV
jgi:glycosyltransferase involved in cell wall biosynthesis